MNPSYFLTEPMEEQEAVHEEQEADNDQDEESIHSEIILKDEYKLLLILIISVLNEKLMKAQNEDDDEESIQTEIKLKDEY